MNVLEKILEEIGNASIKVSTVGLPHKYFKAIGTKKIEEIIRSHMDDIPNCGDCSRRKQYQIGYEDGKKDNGWIPYTEQNMPKKEGVYLVTCDDEEYPVKRMRFKKEDEYCLWYDEHGIYDGVIFAWQPLPKPYKEG